MGRPGGMKPAAPALVPLPDGPQPESVMTNETAATSEELIAYRVADDQPSAVPRPDDRMLALARNRVAIEGVEPEIDGGRFAAKTVVGRPFVLEADIFADGHEKVSAAVLWRPRGTDAWQEAPMRPLANDRWRAHFTPVDNRLHEYTVLAWRDTWETWRSELAKKHTAGQHVSLELEEGARLIALSVGCGRGSEADRRALEELAERMRWAGEGERFSVMMTDDVAGLMHRAGRRVNLSRYERVLPLTVDRQAAVFSAWYEMMPRSQSGDEDRHGTFDDVIARLPYVQGLGFDVLYFPPIHPIGVTNRKGRNNSLVHEPGDPGSPYAIGSNEGGHDAIHPRLGTFEDFHRLVKAAADHGLEIALDFAIQCSPDHPWIRQHKDWFDWRPDGSLKQLWSPMIVYAHNPGNGTIVRTQVGSASRVVARGVTQFAVATTPSDQVVVTIETRMGAANRGEDGMHRRMVRFTPHNGLR